MKVYSLHFIKPRWVLKVHERGNSPLDPKNKTAKQAICIHAKIPPDHQAVQQ